MKANVLSSILAITIAITLFIAGFFTGREFPRHHYERVIDSGYFIDSTTGKACSLLFQTSVKGPANDQGFTPVIQIPKCGEQ